MEYKNLTSFQLDALREVTNIEQAILQHHYQCC